MLVLFAVANFITPEGGKSRRDIGVKNRYGNALKVRNTGIAPELMPVFLTITPTGVVHGH